MKRNIVKLGGSILITGLLLWAIFSEQSLDEFLSIIKNVDNRLLAIYGSLSLAALLLRALRYRLLLRAMAGEQGQLKVHEAVIVAAIRNALVDFLPARIGEASYIYVVNRYGIPVTAAVSSFGFCFLLDVVVLFIVIGLSIPIGFNAEASSQFSSLLIAIALLLVGTLALIILVRSGDRILEGIAAKCERFKRLKTILLAWSAELGGVRESGSALSLVLLTLGLRLAKYISLYVLLLAVVGQWNVGAKDLPALPVAVAFIAAEAGASLPISGLMSFGAYEGAWTGVFELICRGPCESIPSTTVAFAVHVITQVVGYSLGLAALLCFLWREFRKKA